MRIVDSISSRWPLLVATVLDFIAISLSVSQRFLSLRSQGTPWSVKDLVLVDCMYIDKNVDWVLGNPGTRKMTVTPDRQPSFNC